MSGAGSFSGEAVLLVFVALFLAFVAYEIKKWFKAPAAAILLVLGYLLKVIGNWVPLLDLSVELVDKLDSSVVLLVILPALIFEASFGTDWYTFKRALRYIIPMATTVVVGTTMLAAITLKYILQYDFSWEQAILLGVILSATDHVAVVSQLKEIYADERLETLIAGETLVNEATVLVIFDVMLGSFEGETEASESILMFFRLSLGGFLLGMIFALALGLLLKRIINDEVQEVTLTIVATYLLFFVADGTPVKVSGALATVTLGLYMAAYGKTLISSSVEHSLHVFWSTLGTNMESLVLIIGGMLLGMLTLEHTFITWKDVGCLFAMFGLLYIIRGIVVLLHYPIMRKNSVGYGLGWREAIVVTCAGTKGTIATALALMAYQAGVLSDQFATQILFYTVGISALTIIFGSLMIKLSVHFLGLETMTQTQENMLVGVTTAILRNSREKIDKMKRQKAFKLAKWQEVEDAAGADRLLKQIMKRTKIGKKLISRHPKASSDVLLDMYNAQVTATPASLKQEMRRRFFTTLKGIYWHMFSQGLCMGDSVLLLMNAASQSVDDESKPMRDWELIETELYSPRLIRLYSSMASIPVIGVIFRNMLYERMSIAYDCSHTYLEAHDEAKELLDEMEIDSDPELFKAVMVESKEQRKRCKRFIREQIIEGYPSIISEIQTRIACHALLLAQREEVSEIHHRGVIEDLEYEFLRKAIDSSLKLHTFRGNPEPPNVAKMLKNRFPKLSSHELERLIDQAHDCHFQPDEYLYREDDKNEGAYLIINGRVKEFSNWVDQELHIGNLVGVQYLLPGHRAHKMKSSAKALGLVYAARLPIDFEVSDELNRELYLEASEELILLNRSALGLEHVRGDHVEKVVKESTISIIQAGDSVSLATGGILCEGQLGRHHSVSYMKPKDKRPYIAQTLCIILNFSAEMGDCIRSSPSLADAFSRFSLHQGLKLTAGANNKASLGFGMKMMHAMNLQASQPKDQSSSSSKKSSSSSKKSKEE